MKKILLLSLSVLCITAFADTYLVKADLDASRLNPFLQRDIAVIAELEHIAILLVTEQEFSLISDRSLEVLDENPGEDDYYLIRLTEKAVDLGLYGDILFHENNDYLLKIDHAAFEELIKQHVMVKKLFLRPIVLSEGNPQSQILHYPCR